MKNISPPPRNNKNEDILLEEVEWAIARLKRSKSPGVDGISAEMIKAGGNELTKKLHEIYQQIWREGTVPMEWTRSILVTVPKKGDLGDCKNYRTIALISHAAKVLMLMLLNRLKAQTKEYISDE